MIPLPPDTRYKAGTPIEFLVAENTSTFLAYPYPTVVPAQPITPAVASDGELATTPPLPGPPLDPALVGASGSEEAGSGGSISTGDPSASRADGVVEPVVPPATAS